MYWMPAVGLAAGNGPTPSRRVVGFGPALSDVETREQAAIVTSESINQPTDVERRRAGDAFDWRAGTN